METAYDGPPVTATPWLMSATSAATAACTFIAVTLNVLVATSLATSMLTSTTTAFHVSLLYKNDKYK